MSRVTLTGKFTRIDGTPATGTVRVTPSRSPIMDSAGRVVISGPQSFPVQSGGLLEVEIPASNDPDLGPAFTYRIEVILDHASWKISKVWLPYGSATVDLSQVSDFEPMPGVATRVVTIPADGTDGQVLVWDGAGFSWMDAPAGPPGPPGEVTLAALTTALAGKITGTGMTVHVDTSVGTRVLLDHPNGSVMLMGDTGWRDIRASLSTGWELAPSGVAATHRTANQVSLALRVRVATGAPHIGTSRAAQINLISTPTGFTARHKLIDLGNVEIPGGTGKISVSTLNLLVSGGTGTWAAGDTITCNVTFATADPWPATLPGTPL